MSNSKLDDMYGTKQENPPLIKWTRRMALVLVFVLFCGWLDTIKVGFTFHSSNQNK